MPIKDIQIHGNYEPRFGAVANVLRRQVARYGGGSAAAVYFEARGEFVWAVTEADRFAIDRTLTNLADQLDKRVFFQSHRSCIVRIDRIRTIEPAGARSFRLHLDHPDEPKVPLARDRSSKLRERIPFLR